MAQNATKGAFLMKYTVLYNPYAGTGQSANVARAFAEGKDAELFDMTEIADHADFLSRHGGTLVITGGDGTLNRFVNDTDGLLGEREVYYLATGTGNDLIRDIGSPDGEELINVTKYLKDLPVCTVKGKSYRFINGVGYGIDGYCCEVGDELKKTPGKKINYTAIAIKGLLFHFKPVNAKVTVDGKTESFKKVWIAPAMNGRFYGGGMMPTPAQDRRGGGKLSVCVFHDSGKLKTLMIFPSLFKGEHLKHEKYIKVLSGKEISVEFDRPTALQIDGETILGVKGYSASAGKASVNM